MNEITDLVIQKKNNQRVNIFLDEKYAFALDIMKAATLCRGQKLSDEKINRLKTEDSFSRALNNAVRFLGHRARSTKEIEVYLSGKDFADETIEKVIEKLLAEKYLDDIDFTRMWIESRMKFNPKSSWALKFELRQKGIKDSIIENALTNYDDNKAAWDSVQKKLSLWKNLDPEKFRKKLYTFLSNRGFNYETTTDIYTQVRDNNGTSV